MRVKNDEARRFYEQEVAQNRWNKRQFVLQINTLLFESLNAARSMAWLAAASITVKPWSQRFCPCRRDFGTGRQRIGEYFSNPFFSTSIEFAN